MDKYEVKKQKQLELFEKGTQFNQPAKRINIVSLKLVKESSLLYKERAIRSPEDGYKLMKHFLGDLDREAFIVISLDTKNQEFLAAKKKPEEDKTESAGRCVMCSVNVSEKVAKYCLDNKRFNGKIYCYEHQKII